MRVQDEVVAHCLHRHADDGQDVALQEGAARGKGDDALEQRCHLEVFEVDHGVVVSHNVLLSGVSVCAVVWWVWRGRDARGLSRAPGAGCLYPARCISGIR